MRLNIMEQNLLKFKNHYMKTYLNIKSKFETHHTMSSKFNFETSNEDVGFMQLSAKNGEEHAVRLTNLEEAINNVNNDMYDLKNIFQSEGPETDVEKLYARVREIESRVSGDSVSVNHGEFIFTSETEAGTWLENELVHTIGIFWDVFSVLVALAPKRLSGKERADQKYSSERINTTTAENELAASMAYERPQTLYGDKHGNLVPWEEGFGACKTHEKWIIGTQSFKTVTTKQVKKFINGILGNIASGSGGRGLARVLLNEVSLQWNEIVAFIDTFFRISLRLNTSSSIRLGYWLDNAVVPFLMQWSLIEQWFHKLKT